MATYDFYQNDFRGRAIVSNDWSAYAAKAEAQLMRYKRIYTVAVPKDCPNAEDMAICAMAEALHSFDLIANGEGGAIQSVSIGSVSTSYGSAGTQAVDMSPAGQSRELYRIACLYLDIYRGVSC